MLVVRVALIGLFILSARAFTMDVQGLDFRVYSERTRAYGHTAPWLDVDEDLKGHGVTFFLVPDGLFIKIDMPSSTIQQSLLRGRYSNLQVQPEGLVLFDKDRGDRLYISNIQIKNSPFYSPKVIFAAASVGFMIGFMLHPVLSPFLSTPQAGAIGVASVLGCAYYLRKEIPVDNWRVYAKTRNEPINN